MAKLLEIKNLHTYFYPDDSNTLIKAVEGLDLAIEQGEVLGLVGESACGKTISAYSVLGLIQPPGKVTEGEVIFQGKDLFKLNSKQMSAIRGKDIALIFQEPSMALNPVYPIGFQIGEAIRFHNNEISKLEQEQKVLELLAKVGISDPELLVKDYPHNLSGGQAQRAVIAMALACNPKLLIADEPTTSLDVTIQAQIIDLFITLKQEIDFTLVLITHDLALCSEIADRIAIMYAGKIVELAKKEEIFKQPLHPYTQALFSSIPKGDSIKAKLKVIEGSVADPANKPSGCYFNPRCRYKKENCLKQYPEYREFKPGHWVSCYYPLEID